MNIFRDFFGKKEVQTPEIEQKSVASAEFWSLTGPKVDYTISSAIASGVIWLQRNIQEAKLISEENKSGDWVDSPLDPSLIYKIQGTNQGLYQNIAATATDLVLFGNSLWIKLKNKRNKVIGYQYVPWRSVTVNKSSDNVRIDYYTINNTPISVKDCVHFRNGINPTDYLVGYPVWDNLNYHAQADINASVYTKAIIDAPAPSALLIAKKNIDQSFADRVSRMINSMTSQGNAGKAQVLTGEYDFHTMGYTPKDLYIKELIAYTESRICALMGISPIVLGLSSGENPTYSNFESARKITTENLLVPMWNIIATSIYEQTPEIYYESNYRLRFKTEDIQALQGDLNLETERIVKMYDSGIIDRFTALSMTGFNPTEVDKNVYKN